MALQLGIPCLQGKIPYPDFLTAMDAHLILQSSQLHTPIFDQSVIPVHHKDAKGLFIGTAFSDLAGNVDQCVQKQRPFFAVQRIGTQPGTVQYHDQN